MTVRTCANCKIEKLFSEFPKDSRKKNGIRYTCKSCESVRLEEYSKTQAGQERMRKSKWKQQGIDITYDQYTTMYMELKGKCQICKLDFKTLCVDHNHSTGAIRGLLCRQCNIGISALKEDVEVINQAINYLKENK